MGIRLQVPATARWNGLQLTGSVGLHMAETQADQLIMAETMPNSGLDN